MARRKNYKNSNGAKVVKEEPKKDGRGSRVNYDNTRKSKFEKDMKHDCSDNDVRWYANNPELLRAAASIPFSHTTGQQFRVESGTLPAFPGVMKLNWIPMIGGYDATAINAAKDSIYSFVVHANSRNTSYTANDLMLVILAGANVFSAIAMAERAYGLMRVYDQRNKYLPDSLVRAAGFNADDLRANLSNMWFDINEMVARSSQIWIPNNLPFVDRWYWLNTNVYMDSESVKGQYYVLTQRRFLMYDETSSEQGGSLTWATNAAGAVTDTQAANLTWDNFKATINAMISALVDSEDRGVIMGDLLKAYGADQIYALKPLPVDYTVVPVYNREVLTQIENATVVDTVYNSIVQTNATTRLSTDWSLAAGTSIGVASISPKDTMLNFHQKEIPTPEQVMVATRLKVGGNVIGQFASDTTKVGALMPMYTGTEMVTGIRAYSFANSTRQTSVYTYATTYVGNMSDWAVTDFQSLVLGLQLELAFDWSPWINVLSQYGSLVVGTTPIASVTNGGILLQTFGDQDMITTLSTNELGKLHTTALYGEFNVPTI